MVVCYFRNLFGTLKQYAGTQRGHGTARDCGLDIQYALPGTLEQLQEEVRKRIHVFAPGGGYIFSPTNHVQGDVPIENFFKMYEFARKYGSYPIV